MDFYRFVYNFISAERIVTQIYPSIITEFEKRFNTTARKSYVEIQHDYWHSRYEIIVVVETDRERYYIPIGEVKDSFRLYGVERAFELMIPKPQQTK
jgi:hypothetical protein